MPENFDELIAAWWKNHDMMVKPGLRDRTSEEEIQAADAASDRVSEIVESGGQRALDLVMAIATTAKTPERKEFLGSGPMEDLITHHGHGDDLTVEIINNARKNRPFREVLSEVWVTSGVLAPENEARLKSFITVRKN